MFVLLFVLALCSSWDGKQGPVKDVYSLANNPQYRLEVTCPAGGAAVWVLLTRHITDKVQRIPLQQHDASEFNYSLPFINVLTL